MAKKTEYRMSVCLDEQSNAILEKAAKAGISKTTLDPIAEYDIYMMIYKMLDNKTSFFVSHRLASCRFCDRIFLIQEGRLIADGSHDTLIKTCQLYNEMFNKQAQFYTT